MKGLLIGAIVLVMQVATLAVPSHQVSTTSILIATPFSYRIKLPIMSDMQQRPSVGVFEIISSRNFQTDTETVYDYQLQSFSIDQLVIAQLGINLPAIAQLTIDQLPIDCQLINCQVPN